MWLYAAPASPYLRQAALRVVPYIPIGQWMGMTAYRKSLEGLILGPAIFQWNVEKSFRSFFDNAAGAVRRLAEDGARPIIYAARHSRH